MKKKWIIPILIILILVSGGVYVFSGKKKKGVEVKTSPAAKGKVTSYFSTSGNLQSKNKKDYYVSTPAKVLKVNKSVGDSVKSGDIIAELEVQDLSIQLQTAQKQYDNGQLQLDSLKKQKDNLANAQALKTTTTQSTGVDIDTQIQMQQNQVDIAKLNIQSIQQNINKQQKYIKADIDGIVTALNIKEGSIAASQVAAVSVEDASNLQAVVNVNQYDISRVAAGQDVTIKFNNKSFNGKVSLVDPSATKIMSTSGSDTVIKVTVDVTGNDGTLKSGFDVDIDIKTGEKDNIIKIPAEAVLTDKNDKEKVFVVKDGIAKETFIKTGLTSDTEYEVTEGLSEGDKIVLNPSATVMDGVKVTDKEVSK